MSKKSIKVISLLVLAATIFTTAAFAFNNSDKESSSRASAYISSESASITRNGGGSISINFSLTCMDYMNALGASTIKLYKSNGTLLKTYSYTSYPSMVTTNNYHHSGSVSYSGTSGQYYYAVITFYASNSSGSDSINLTTATVKA